MFTKLERQRYNENRERACKRLGITKNDYNWLRRKGEALHKFYEDNCNGDIEDKDYENETKSLYGVTDNFVKYLKLFVYYQTDPRGASIYLDRVKIPENNYTQAVCIY
jgi:hypothetical protein